jgi:carboxypeptidase C (cathepsin A)
MMGLLEENGPCFVAEDSKTTYLNPWSWNNEVNMLYIDQPTQVGFSYDVPTNCTVQPIAEGGEPDNELEGSREYVTTPTDFNDGLPEVNLTHGVGTFSSQNATQTENSTRVAAHSLWHFAQTWFFEFPHYKPADNRVSLWAESYGGHYGPGFFSVFEQQNEKIANGSSPEKHAHYLHLDTLGIVNGLIDLRIQLEAWISYPFNNTYGLQLYNESVYEPLMHNFTRPGGCKDKVELCQEALRQQDPDFFIPGLYAAQLSSTDDKLNATELCEQVTQDCIIPQMHAWSQADAGWYDIAHPAADPFPAPHMHGYLLQADTLRALGVPVNHSASSSAVQSGFTETYDVVRTGFLDAIAYLLSRGVKVHMMYGDRDYACNWVGGEKCSLAVPWSRQKEFAEAGYAPFIAGGDISGMTRQVGNYSFSRVFQAGHEVPSYQPEAAYEIFRRAMFGLDIPTGLVEVTDDLVTDGPTDVWHIKNEPPQKPEPRCYILRPISCLPEIWERFKAGNVTVKDYYVVEGGEGDGGSMEWDRQKPMAEEL